MQILFLIYEVNESSHIKENREARKRFLFYLSFSFSTTHVRSRANKVIEPVSNRFYVQRAFSRNEIRRKKERNKELKNK